MAARPPPMWPLVRVERTAADPGVGDDLSGIDHPQPPQETWLS
jgi:hypothetical protein